ncbi:hypothetical protein AB8A31_02000 [Tardiphaga sp. 804_B3_N1_9]|jgi:hypothetical protein|uniref:hypothetical protein n=1 Tax=Tardiphaga TaxID=1395974 RepID=UPI001585F90D|nr:hypothetical protein [Tardiphaga robiniae]MDR6660065.1 hypothetical protein [Tardiphaga robiniae]NUU42313.1 hypothetical protein [Tardiphaga robiniae]
MVVAAIVLFRAATLARIFSAAAAMVAGSTALHVFCEFFTFEFLELFFAALGFRAAFTTTAARAGFLAGRAIGFLTMLGTRCCCQSIMPD